MAPVEALGQIADAGGEVAAFESGVFVILAGSQDINDVESGLQTGELLAGFTEQGIGPDFSPEEHVAAVDRRPSVGRERDAIPLRSACVLLASGGCTGWNKFEFLTGKRVSLVFSAEEPSWQSGGHEFDPRQLHQ